MSDHTKSAGEAESIADAKKADAPWKIEIDEAARDAYLAKLTPTKAEPRWIAKIREIHDRRQAAIDRGDDTYWSRELAPGTNEYILVKRPNVRVTHYHRGKLLSHITAIEADRDALSAKLKEVESNWDRDTTVAADMINTLQSKLTAARNALEEERERCAKVITDIAAFTRKTTNEIAASASDKRDAEAVARLLDQLVINIMHIPLTPQTEEGKK